MPNSADTTNPKDLIGQTKPNLSLIPSGLLVPLTKVMELGARKYGPFNWREAPVRYSIYIDAALRHLYQALDREDIDVESGQSHLAHAAACCAILLDAQRTKTLIDDRPKVSINISEQLRRDNEKVSSGS